MQVPIKVVSIVSRMNLGGVAVLLSDLHDLLPSQEFSHVLITGVCADNEIDIFADRRNDPNIIRIATMGRAPSLIKDVSTFISLRKILKNLSPDIVHTHTSKAGVLGRIAAITLGKRISVVHTFHGHHLYGYFSKLIVKVMIFTERVLATKTDLFVADSKQVMIDLKNAAVGSKNSWKVIPPGIRTLMAISRESARTDLQIDNQSFVICWIGRFTDIKNPLLALQSFKALPSELRNRSQLIMLGEGELLQECKEFASAHSLKVLFSGWETNIAPYLASANLLLMTSKNEGFGMVIAESGFFGVPTVSTDVGGVREFIDDGVNGILVQAEPEQIAASISALSQDSSKLQNLGAKAKETTLKRFTVATFVSDHKVAYTELVTSKSKVQALKQDEQR